jgi:hypothetical protein
MQFDSEEGSEYGSSTRCEFNVSAARAFLSLSGQSECRLNDLEFGKYRGQAIAASHGSSVTMIGSQFDKTGPACIKAEEDCF